MASLALAFDILARDKGASKTFDKVGDSAERAGRKGEKSGSLMKGAAGVMGKAFLAAGAAVAAAGIATKISGIVEAGSGLQQALGGAEAVFKKSFGDVDKTAAAAADSLGLSRRQYLELATVLGAGLKNKGIKDYAGATQDLVKVGADLAAQYGGSTTDAVGALSSALRGETDPIERYGVALNQTAIQAEAMRLGLVKGSVDTGKVAAAQLRAEVAQRRYNDAVKEHGKNSSEAKTAQAGLISAEGSLKKSLAGTKGELSDTAKAQAALSLITRQTKDAQGAFGRESDTLAGKQQRLAASVENIKERMGSKLLPVLTRVSGWFLEKGLPAIERFGGWLTGKLWPAIKQGYATILPGIQKALAIVTGGVGEGTVSWKKIGDVITTKVIPFIALLISSYLPVLATNIRIGIEVVKALYRAFQTWKSIVSSVIAFVLHRFADLTSMWANVLDALGNVPGFGWAKDAAKKLKGVSEKADGVATALDNIDRNVQIEVGFKATTGRIKVGGQSVNIGMRAEGGPVTTGRLYQVGDNPDGSWNDTTELLRASGPARVVNQDEMRKAMGAEVGASQAGGRVDFSEATLQRLAAILSGVSTKAVFSVRAADAAIGATIR